MIENPLLLGLVLGALAFICQWEELNPKFLQAGRPLMGGTLTGLVMGDIVVGMAVGAILELAALGVNTYGGATIPDFLSGSILGTFFAISSKHEGVTVGGVQVHITDRDEMDPIGATLVMLDELMRLYPDDFEWRFDDYDPETPYWIDKLTGSDYVRTSLDAGESPEEVARGWRRELAGFEKLRREYLIYADRGRPLKPPKGRGR